MAPITTGSDIPEQIGSEMPKEVAHATDARKTLAEIIAENFFRAEARCGSSPRMVTRPLAVFSEYYL
jgi:hypothetical protein